MSKRYVLLLVVREKNGMARLDRGQGSNGWSSRPRGGILFRNHTPSRRRDLRGSERARGRREKKEKERRRSNRSTFGKREERRNDVPERSKASRKIVFDDSLILARAVIIRENSLTDAPVRGVLRVSLFFTVTLKPRGGGEGEDRPKISLSSFSRS